MSPHEDRWHTHQGGQTNGRTLVVGEDQERAVESAGWRSQHDAVGDRRGSMLTNTKVQHAAIGVGAPGLGGTLGRGEGLGVGDRGVIRTGQICGAAPEFRKDIGYSVNDLSGRGTGGKGRAGFEDWKLLLPTCRELASLQAFEQLSFFGVSRGPGIKALLPFGM